MGHRYAFEDVGGALGHLTGFIFSTFFLFLDFFFYILSTMPSCCIVKNSKAITHADDCLCAHMLNYFVSISAFWIPEFEFDGLFFCVFLFSGTVFQ